MKGRWRNILLADGNIGIGGDPARLLARAACLVAPGGRAVVEVSPDDVENRTLVRLSAGSGDARASTAFPWAVVGSAALHGCAAAGGSTPAETWHDTGRAFTLLVARQV